MNLYLDAEFNGHGGELISLALASPEMRHFYGVCRIPENVHPWVAEHVVPLLGKSPYLGGHSVSCPDKYASPASFQGALHRYLEAHPDADIYADWPHDFAHLMNCLAGPTFDEALNYQCTMHLIQTPLGEPRPEMPHHALSDAVALMRWHMGIA